VAAPAAWIEIARISHVLVQAPAAPSDWLSESELARLAGLHHAARRAQYLAGHWLARVLLARAFGGAALHWALLERRSLPPAVQGQGGALRVSISHTEDWIAAAVANVAIGIDLEQRARILDATIEPLLLDADEAPDSLPADALLQRWVAKEAWIKRDTGSALAGRIERLHLQAASREHADVVVDSHAEFHFAVAVVPGCMVQRPSEPELTPGAAFALVDRA
jgi:4'-phosphopantetheinyl transferase